MKKILIITLALIFVLALSGVALAGLPPHGGYVDTTNYCASCHDVHDATGPSDSAFGMVLLRWTTVFGACQYCHDGTAGNDYTGGANGGINVWNIINNNGGTIQARHRPTATAITQYGFISPTSATGIGLSADMTLTCADCHSVHDNPARVISSSENYSCDTTTTASSHLLLQDPAGNGVSGATTSYYGAWFCADCHVRRHSGYGGVNNHPVNAYTLRYGGYSGNKYTTGTNYAGLNRSNVNFKMQPVGGGTSPARTDPICQHCHEDARDVETAFTAPTVTVGMVVPYVTATAYWSPTAVNPRFFAFPHESTNLDFRVETGDDLCLNCHATASLP